MKKKKLAPGTVYTHDILTGSDVAAMDLNTGAWVRVALGGSDYIEIGLDKHTHKVAIRGSRQLTISLCSSNVVLIGINDN